jgi:predicted transposase/invertase (TIGR01784 family)
LNYDNACKYLAQKYPRQFARWLLSVDTDDIQVLKTELSLEPIRADSLTFLQTSNQILHLEFQTLPVSNPPLPLRMLDYWMRLHRQYGCHIEQVVLFLKRTTSEVAFTEQFEAVNTRHRYRVIRLWEQDPAPLLANPALLPFATLAQSDSPNTLLEQVAAQVARIESREERANLSACAGVLAGLRFNDNLIRQLLREDIMRESTFYQYIRQEGRQQGIQEGIQEGEVALLLRQLIRRFGTITPQLQEQIRTLSISQLEDLAEAFLEFSNVTDLINWLEVHSS